MGEQAASERIREIADRIAWRCDLHGLADEVKALEAELAASSTSEPREGYDWICGKLPAELTRGTPTTNAEKLRTLAGWHDARDNDRGYRGAREVQADLRRIADELEAVRSSAKDQTTKGAEKC